MEKASYVLKKERFGQMLKKGAKGEQVIIERLQNITEVKDLTDYEAFKKFQRKGLDFEFKDRKTGVWLRGDSKANIIGGGLDKKGVTFMEFTKGSGAQGWFLTSKSDYIFLYDVNSGRSYFYDLDAMRKHMENKKNSLKFKQVQDGAYGVWYPVDHPLIQELK